MKHNTDKIPDIILERALLGELPPEEMKKVKVILEKDPGEKERFEALKKSNEEFFKMYPVRTMVEKIKEKAERGEESEEKTPRIQNWIQKWKIALPAMGLALVALLVIPGLFRDRDGAEITRLKGQEPHLIVYHKKGKEVELLNPGASVRQGDLLQIGYVAAGYPYGLIFSVDGNKTVTLHHPSRVYQATRLEKTSGEKLLPHSYELDDAPRMEKFFFLVSKEPVPVQKILEQVKQVSLNKIESREFQLSLEDNIRQFSFILKKGEAK